MGKKLRIVAGRMLRYHERFQAHVGNRRTKLWLLLGIALHFVGKHRAPMGKRNNRLFITAGVVVLLALTLIPAAKSALHTASVPPATPTKAATSTAMASPRPTNTPTAVPATATPTAIPPTATPTPVPATPTPRPFTFPTLSRIADVDVSGLTVEAAKQHVADAIDHYKRTIILRTDGYTTTLQTAQFLTLPSAEQLVDRARAHVDGPTPLRLPLQVAANHAALQEFVEHTAPAVEQTPATTVLSDPKALTQTFTFAMRPGRHLDVPRTVERIEREIVRADAATQVDLVVQLVTATRPPMSELDRVLRQHATFWKGIAGFYVRNLATGETIGYNADTVFSGASVMKVPIMIFAYSRLGQLNDEQRGWMEKMIIESQNLEANSLLAAAVGGSGTEAALQGTNEMTDMLKNLGLEHTYQLIPYESGDWLIQQSLLPKGGPAQEGQAPFTEADPYIRTSPREIGQLYTMLDECTRGTGLLLQKVGGRLNQQICSEMIGWLQRPHDQERMVAGLPHGTKIAHKGGWINDMQADVGIVDSPGGRYVAAIYIWRNGLVTNANASPSPYLGDFSHTIYSFFNPEPLDSPPVPKAGGG
jgi:beta-lactamase class A